MAKTKNRNNASKPRELIVDPNDIIENKPTPAEIYKEAEQDILKHQVQKKTPHIAVEGRDYTTITTVEVQEVTVSELREAIFGIDGLDDKYLQESVVDVINQRLADMGSPIFDGFYQNTQDATVTRVYAEVVNSVLGERITYATIQKVDEDLSREMTVSNIKLPDESYRVHLLSAVDYVKANDLQINGEQYQKRIAKAIQEMRKEHSMAQEENPQNTSSSQAEVQSTPAKTEVEINATENKTLVAHTEAGDITADSVTVTLSACKIKPIFKRARNSNGTYTLVAMRGEGDMTPPREFMLKVLRLVWDYQEYTATFFDEVLFKDDALKTGLQSQLTDAEARQAVGVKKGKGLFDDPLNPCNIEDVIVHDDYIKIVNPSFENDASIFEVA